VKGGDFQSLYWDIHLASTFLYFRREPIMKKVSFCILSLILLLGPFSIAIAQKLPTIAAVHPFTGRFAFAGIEGSAAMQDVVDMTNEAGGINGKKLQYYWADGEYKDDVGIAAFKRLYAQYTPQVMFGQSTGMTKALGPEIKSRYKVLYSAYTMTSEAANPKENPYLFIAAPTYAEQFGVLLKYIAKEKPGANIAFFYSDTEFGREPIPAGREMCKKMGLNVVAEEVSQVGGVDLTTQILDMKAKKVDYCIFQGFVSNPIATVIKQSKDYGLNAKFMGTFWSTEKQLLNELGPLAGEYVGVSAYSFFYQDDLPMMKKIKEWTKKKYPTIEYRSQSYMQNFMTTLLFVESFKRADKMKGGITADNMVQAFQSIKNYDVGGLMPPVTIKDNSIPVGRVYRGNASTMRFDPISDWTRMD
jgi:branched-chain amino acid transport system substrate-binding protein